MCGKVDPPITLIAGWWSVGLTFAGKPCPELIRNYRVALLFPFKLFFHLVPNDGLKKYIITSVPCMHNAEGHLAPTGALYEEFQQNNPHIKKWDLPGLPMWTRGALVDPTKSTSAFTFLLSNPTNMSQCLLCAPCFIYGKCCIICTATTYTQHCQCGKCFHLTHHTDKCPHSEKYLCCGICSKTRHTQATHNAGHCGKLHPTITCDCPTKCFNYFFNSKDDKGHYAFSDTCPLKKNIRRYGSKSAASTIPTATVPDIAAVTPAQPPVSL